MLSAKDISVVYETLLMSPGMGESVKISLNIPRRNAMLLAKFIELGLTMQDSPQAGFVGVVGKESLNELNSIGSELLQKAGLSELYERLNSLQSK